MKFNFYGIILEAEKKYPEKMKYVWHIANKAGYVRDGLVKVGCWDKFREIMVSKIPETKVQFGMIDENNGDGNSGTGNGLRRRLHGV